MDDEYSHHRRRVFASFFVHDVFRPRAQFSRGLQEKIDALMTVDDRPSRSPLATSRSVNNRRVSQRVLLCLVFPTLHRTLIQLL